MSGTYSYSKEDAKKYLESLGKVKFFYISEIHGNEVGLIYYVMDDNTSWVFMDDNDEMVLACIDYLKSIGAPVLKNIKELRDFEELNKLS